MRSLFRALFLAMSPVPLLGWLILRWTAAAPEGWGQWALAPAHVVILGLSIVLTAVGAALVFHARGRRPPDRWVYGATLVAAAGGLVTLLAPRIGS